MNMDVLWLSQDEVKGLLDMDTAISAVENAFREYALGTAEMPPKTYLYFDEGDLRVMPSHLDGIASTKIVNVHTGNRQRGIPTVMALLVVNSPDTGQPLCVMDGTYITDIRTGAVGGVATKYMARKGSKVVGIFGAGAQARTQVLAHSKVLDIEKVLVSCHVEGCADAFISEMSESLDTPIAFASPEEVCECDVLITTTPSRTPVVKSEWVGSGTHINAIGADAKGKQELDPTILKRARVVVDDYTQATHSGEVNVPISQGLFGREDIAGTLGDVVAGKLAGRTSDDEITVFDSTGLAVQDAACARVVYEGAKREGIGSWMKLF